MEGSRNVTYSYDEAGNRVEEKTQSAAGTVTVAYSYDAAGRLVSADASGGSATGTTSYTYDANGNLVAQSGPEGSFGYAYTAENRLQTTRLNGEVVMAAVYDGLGHRTFQLSRAEMVATGEDVVTQPGIAVVEPGSESGVEIEPGDVPEKEPPKPGEVGEGWTCFGMDSRRACCVLGRGRTRRWRLSGANGCGRFGRLTQDMVTLVWASV